MAEELIDSYIDRDGVRQDTEFMLTQLNELEKGFKKVNGLTVTLQGTKNGSSVTRLINEQTEAQGQLNTTTQKLYNSKNKLAEAEAKVSKNTEGTTKSIKEQIKAKEAEAKLIEKINKEKEKLAKQQAKEQKQVDDLTNDYKQLSLAYNEAALRAKNMALRFGENHPLTLEAVKDAKDLNDILQRIDRSVGQHQRNVGNYASATFALTQVARELPAFANSMATGISAITNNVPILLDQYKALAVQVGKFNAFKILAGSLLSFNTILPLTFLLLQSYSKEIGSFFSQMFKGKQTIDQLKTAQEAYNEALRSSEVKEATKNLDEMKNVIKLAKDGIIDKERALKEYNEGLGKVIGKAGSLNEAEQLLVKNGPAYLQAMYLRALANQALEKSVQAAIEAEEIRRKKDEDFSSLKGRASVGIVGQATAPGYVPGASDFLAGVAARQQVNQKAKAEAVKEKTDFADFYRDLADKARSDLSKIKGLNLTNLLLGDPEKDKSETELKKRLENQRRAAFEIQKLLLQDQLEFQSSIANNSSLPENIRIKARQRAFEAERELIRTEADFEKGAADLNAREIELINLQAAQKEVNAKTVLASDLASIRKQISDREKEDIKELNAFVEREIKTSQEKQSKESEAAFKRENNVIERNKNIRLIQLNNEYAAGKISKKKYEEEKEKIERDALVSSLRNQINYYKALADLYITDAQRRKEALDQIAAAEQKLNLILSEGSKKRKDDTKKDNEEIKQSLIQMAGELRETVFGIFEGNVDREKDRIRGQIDALEAKKLKEIEVANQTIASTDERERKIKEIEVRAAAEKQALEAKQRRLDEQKARFERARAIASVIQNTGVAVSGYLAEQNYAMAVIAGIVGALQITKILATPIPKYAKGKSQSNKYEGPAWVGDGGKSELIVREDGSIEKTPSTPTLTWVGKNDLVMPDAKKVLSGMAFAQTKSANYTSTATNEINFDVSSINSTLNKGFKGLKETIKSNRPVIQTKGINKDLLFKYGSNWDKHI